MGSYGLGIQILDAQTVTGRITDRKSCPVTGATVVLQAPDSTFVSAAVSTDISPYRPNRSSIA